MAFRTQKISQMTPKGADLEATDLIEVSTIESGSYVTRSITGQELIDAIPPTTIEWGDIGGTLSNQTDLNTALNGKVPTTRTLTINGVAQDLSADRSWTIATGLTVGTTPISSGTIGRVLFQGTGNVLQQSSSLFWDDAALRFQVGSSSTSPFGSPLIFMGKDQNAETNFQISNSTSGTAATVGFRVFGANNRSTFLGEFSQGHTGITEFASHYVIEPNAGGVKHGLIISIPETTTGSDLMVYTGGRNLANRKLTLFGGTGNLAINTTTDAGFRLDVNGTARVQGNVTFGSTSTTGTATIQGSNIVELILSDTLNGRSVRLYKNAGSGYIIENNSGNQMSYGYASNYWMSWRNSTKSIAIASTGSEPTPDATSIFDLQSTTKGFLPPRMTTTQKNAIASPATGLQVYDTTLNQMSYYNGTTWTNI